MELGIWLQRSHTSSVLHLFFSKLCVLTCTGPQVQCCVLAVRLAVVSDLDAIALAPRFFLLNGRSNLCPKARFSPLISHESPLYYYETGAGFVAERLDRDNEKARQEGSGLLADHLRPHLPRHLLSSGLNLQLWRSTFQAGSSGRISSGSPLSPSLPATIMISHSE